MFKKILFISIFIFSSLANAANLPKDKNFGIETNPFYLLVVSSGEDTMLSGTFSYFDHTNNAEIAIPIHIMHLDNDYKQETIDVHYRKFLNNHIGGFYLSGFARVARLRGETDYSQDYKYAKQTKFGGGMGIGVRIFSSFGLYWGASLSLGRYLTGDNDTFRSDSFTLTDDQPYIFDVEFFKFGYSF